MASVELSRRVEKIVGYSPLSALGELQRREFHEALLDAESFEDLPGKWQAAIMEAVEQSRPKLRVVASDWGVAAEQEVAPALSRLTRPGWSARPEPPPNDWSSRAAARQCGGVTSGGC